VFASRADDDSVHGSVDQPVIIIKTTGVKLCRQENNVVINVTSEIKNSHGLGVKEVNQ
jgi:hypothetical protein